MIGLLEYSLAPAVAHLRNTALRPQGLPAEYEVPTAPIIDARTWLSRDQDEDWLIWKARKCSQRLAHMRLSNLPGERIVGRPELGRRRATEEMEYAQLESVFESIPKSPGGDNGHFQPNFEKLLHLGIGGMIDEIDQLMEEAQSAEKRTFYESCRIVLRALSGYALRVAENSDGEARRICRRIALKPPQTFHEGLQLLFLTLIGLWFGEDHHLTCPGRLDRLLFSLYESDLYSGKITREDALELLSCLYIQCNMILYPGSAIAVMVGGRDADGLDVTNELSYLCIVARKVTGLVYPTIGVAWNKKTPDDFMNFACRVIATGIGDPAFFNDPLISEGLQDHGVSFCDSVNYMNSTCVEIKPVGAANIWVTAPYFNLPKALLDVVKSVSAGRLPHPATFAEFKGLVQNRISLEVSGAAADLDRVWHQRAHTGCAPLASCFIEDCLERGLDFDRGGARYNWVENSFVGLANLVDSLGTIKHLVYEKNELSLLQIHEMVDQNFQGFEKVQYQIQNEMPKYGNNDPEVDLEAVAWTEFLCNTTESCSVGPHRYVPGFFCWITHEKMGADTGATPDGRFGGFPLSDGAGAAQGREKNGPTASILSTTRWSHRRALGGLVHNLKLSKNTFHSEKGQTGLKSLIQTYLLRGGFEIQVNMVSSEELKQAQKHPDQYQDLLVRVAGYSDYFVHLNKNMQSELIARTEHELG